MSVSFYHGSPYSYVIWGWTVGLLMSTVKRHGLTPSIRADLFESRQLFRSNDQLHHIQCTLKIVTSLLFLKHVRIFCWIAASFSASPISSSHQTLHPFPALHKMTKTDESVHIHLEDGNCYVCWNVGKFPIFDAAHTQKLKFYIKIYVFSYFNDYLFFACF